MLKKPSDKHLHLHMKSYHKEKDGQAFAKKHGYKVSNYVKTGAGSRMNIEEFELDEKKLGLWDRIRAKRASGRKMNPKGHKDAPTDDEIRKAKGESSQLGEMIPKSTMYALVKDGKVIAKGSKRDMMTKKKKEIISYEFIGFSDSEAKELEEKMKTRLADDILKIRGEKNDDNSRS